jgi:hypothetical protein
MALPQPPFARFATRRVWVEVAALDLGLRRNAAAQSFEARVVRLADRDHVVDVERRPALADGNDVVDMKRGVALPADETAY